MTVNYSHAHEIHFKQLIHLPGGQQNKPHVCSISVQSRVWGMWSLASFCIKWPLAKTSVGHLQHYVNGEILGSVLFSSEIK